MAKSVEQIPGIVRADVNFASGVMGLEYDPAVDPRAKAIEVVRSTGHTAEDITPAPDGSAPVGQESRSWMADHAHDLATALAGILIVLGWLLGRFGTQIARGDELAVIFYAAAILSGGWLVFRRALVSVRSRSLDMNVLMAIAVLGAAAIGEWSEGAAVVFLFSVGGMLESRSLARTRRSIRDLMDLAPPIARVLAAGGVETEVPAGSVELGTLVVIRPGERIPLDGVVEHGRSAVDESPITGESVPSDKEEGDTVFAGSLNTSGLLEVRVTSRAADSTLARIIYLVEEAQASRAPSQQFVDRFARVYTPAVIALAVAIATVPPVLSGVLDLGWGGFNEWFYRALVMLVVSCPCALVISTPVSIVSAITRATRDGVLVKGGAHLETAARVRVVAFDKTGTLTCGVPEVADVVALGAHDAAQVVQTAAALEAHSNHPLARAVVRAASAPDRPGTRPVTDFEDVPGRGVRGVVDGVRTAVGTPLFVAEEAGAPLGDEVSDAVERLEGDGRTVLVVLSAGRVAGVIGVADQVRPDATATVNALRSGGVEHVVMLTGDNERTAAAIAAHAGVPEYRARLLPADKVAAVRELGTRHGVVAMVGDGINDAPALAASDLGIAMGAAGSDTALETADVALMSDDLSQLPRFFDLGRRTVAVIRQNVVISLAVKFAVLALAAGGWATLWMAVFADTGVSLLVTLNGMRLLRRRTIRRVGESGVQECAPRE